MFRGWSRLCLHAASLSAAEGASAAATALARAARAEAVETEARAAAEKAAANAEVTVGGKQSQRDTTRESMLTAEPKHKDGHQSNLERDHQLCLMKMMVRS